MPAERLSIAQVNASNTKVLFDANVVLEALKSPTSDARGNLISVRPELRFVADPALFEVAFARSKGRAPATLRENQRRLGDLLLKRSRWSEREATRFARFLDDDARLVRGRMTLGDALLAAAVFADKGCALATRNARDFDHLPLRLVEEFARPQPRGA